MLSQAAWAARVSGWQEEAELIFFLKDRGRRVLLLLKSITRSL